MVWRTLTKVQNIFSRAIASLIIRDEFFISDKSISLKLFLFRSMSKLPKSNAKHRLWRTIIHVLYRASLIILDGFFIGDKSICGWLLFRPGPMNAKFSTLSQPILGMDIWIEIIELLCSSWRLNCFKWR